ncbi:MAG: DNA polymerase III subunit delta, partial [Betaproteobacteria bacterium]|nr:DNA polymerase III subunit delta [Betaproteobacteria bacterium]
MNLRAEQLDAALAKKLAALYVLVGDDWLQLDEARQAIARQARTAGVTERLRFEVEGRFDW